MNARCPVCGRHFREDDSVVEVRRVTAVDPLLNQVHTDRFFPTHPAYIHANCPA